MTLNGYYINLSKRTDRNAKMQERLKATRHKINRLEATGAESVKEMPPYFLKKEQDSPSKRATFATVLSHQSAIRHAKANGWEAAMILEDDAILCDDFDQRLDLFLSLVPKDWQILYLGIFPFKPPIKLGEHLYKIRQSYGAFGYIIRNTAYDRILTSRIYHALDNLLADRVQVLKRCYAFFPFLVKVEPDFSDIQLRDRTLTNISQHYQPELKPPPAKHQPMRLYVNYFKHKDSVRRSEIDTCLQKNIELLNRGIIDEIINISDTTVPGITNIPFSGRPTFSDFFRHASDDINIIANADIHLDDTILLAQSIKEKELFALSRYDVVDNELSLYDHADSQDVWIFRGKTDVIADFPQGYSGCLSGDTIIQYNRGARINTRPITLKLLYERFNNIKQWRGDAPDTYIYSLKNGVFFYNKIKAVVESGEKETIKLTFDDGTFLVLTPDHRVAVSESEYVMAGALNVGDEVLTREGRPKSKSPEAKRAVVYIKHHPYAEVKNVRGHIYKRVRRARLVYEAHFNGLPYENFISILRGDEQAASKLQFTEPSLEIHHKDGNSLNDVAENLDLLTKQEHARIHLGDVRYNSATMKKIVAITQHGKEMTYDIQMDAPAHNFLANGTLVHNCDNKLAFEFDKAGYTVTNPSRSIRTIHLHRELERDYVVNGTSINRLPPPYKVITPTYL